MFDCHGTATLSVSMSTENLSILLYERYLCMLLGLGSPKLSSANGIKKFNWFCIAGCEMIVMGFGDGLRSKPTTTTAL